MNKLKLDLESLAVETFDTAAPAEPRGTVHGLSGTCTDPESCDYWCQSLWPSDCCTAAATCPASCNGSCNESCYGTCGGLTCGATCGPTEPNVCPY